MSRKPKSLKKKIILRLFLITLIVFILTGFFILDLSRRALDQSLDKAIRARVEGLVSITDMENDGEIEFEFADELMPDYSGPDPRAYFLLRRLVDNSEIERSRSLEGTELLLPESLPDLPPHKSLFWYGRVNGRTIRFIALREMARLDTDNNDEEEGDSELMLPGKLRASINDGELIPPLPNECLFVVGVDTIDTSRQFAGIVRRTSIALGVGLILLLLTEGIAISRSLRPLSVLEREVQDISESNLEPVSIPGVREIAGVAGTLNDALRRLKEAFERERRFTADVAHELRTPISEIRSLAEVALKWGDKLNEYNRTNYQDFLSSAEQMQKIIVTLLSLARCDAGILTERKERFELGPFIDSLWKQYREKAAARDITCRVAISPGISLSTDKSLIRAVLENLFSNAVDYTPPGGTIEWEAGLHQDKLFFTISNTVAGLSAEDLPRLFERFWRKDAARTPDGVHNGLGLSTARSLAAVIGLSVTARLAPPDILTIIISG